MTVANFPKSIDLNAHTQQGSPPRHVAELDGNPQDSGGVGPDSRLKRGDVWDSVI